VPLTRWLHDPTILELERSILREPAEPIFKTFSYQGTQQILLRNNLTQR